MPITAVKSYGILHDHRASVPRMFQKCRTSDHPMQSAQKLSTEREVVRPRVWVIVFSLAIIIRLLNIAVLPSDPETPLQEDASLYWVGATVLLVYWLFSSRQWAGRITEI